MRYFFIGAGKMARSMVGGLLQAGFPAQTITCIGGGGDSARQLAADTGIRAARTPDEAAARAHQAQTIVLACKPQQLGAIDLALRESARGKLLVSILAGQPIAKVDAALPGSANTVWAMPNTPSRIGAGITGYCVREALSREHAQSLEHLLQAMGERVEVHPSQMHAVVATSGSGPAYLFEWARGWIEAAESLGLPAETARTLTLQTILGAARLLIESGEDPETLRDAVASKGGTTRQALDSLQRDGLPAIIQRALQAAHDRSAELAQAD